MKTKTNNINGVKYTFTTADQPVVFFCHRCKQTKTSKKYAEYEEYHMHKKICSDCYDNLTAEHK